MSYDPPPDSSPFAEEAHEQAAEAAESCAVIKEWQSRHNLKREWRPGKRRAFTDDEGNETSAPDVTTGLSLVASHR